VTEPAGPAWSLAAVEVDRSRREVELWALVAEDGTVIGGRTVVDGWPMFEGDHERARRIWVAVVTGR
jgi:hypothetical protein